MRWRVLGSRRRVSGDAIVERLNRTSVTHFVIQSKTEITEWAIRTGTRIGRRVAEVEGFKGVGGIETVW